MLRRRRVIITAEQQSVVSLFESSTRVKPILVQGEFVYYPSPKLHQQERDNAIRRSYSQL